jgi:hypothetical protein
LRDVVRTESSWSEKFCGICNLASVKTPGVLLFNDRIAHAWTVWVDGKRAPLLRCNFIMRGVFLPPGDHAVEFRFLPSLKTLYISACAILVGILIAGYLVVTRPPKIPRSTEAAAPRAEKPPAARKNTGRVKSIPQ